MVMMRRMMAMVMLVNKMLLVSAPAVVYFQEHFLLSSHSDEYSPNPPYFPHREGVLQYSCTTILTVSLFE